MMCWNAAVLAGRIAKDQAVIMGVEQDAKDSIEYSC